MVLLCVGEDVGESARWQRRFHTGTHLCNTCVGLVITNHTCLAPDLRHIVNETLSTEGGQAKEMHGGHTVKGGADNCSAPTN